MRIFLLSILVFFSSCSFKTNDTKPLVKYKTTLVTDADFIRSLMALGFIKHGKSFFTKINDKDFFADFKQTTLENIITKIFVNKLANEKKITINDAELEEWIQSRVGDVSKEDLILTLKTNNITYKDWRGLFKDQLLHHKVVEAYSQQDESLKNNENEESNTEKKADGLLIGVLSFQDSEEADRAYKEISKKSASFEDYAKKKNLKNVFNWVKEENLPFYDKIKNQSLNQVSKPINSSWGNLLVLIKKKGKFIPEESLTSTHVDKSLPKDLLSNFKNDPELQINTNRLYSLKISR